MNWNKVDDWFYDNLGLGMFFTGCVITIALFLLMLKFGVIV